MFDATLDTVRIKCLQEAHAKGTWVNIQLVSGYPGLSSRVIGDKRSCIWSYYPRRKEERGDLGGEEGMETRS